MFIEIDEKCIELLNEDKYTIFFNGLAHSINNGKNYIYLSKKTLELLYNSKKIDLTSRKIYKRIFDNSSEDLAIKKSVSRRVMVANNGEDKIKIIDNQILIPIDIAIEKNLFDTRTNLICENLSDCNFFGNIAKLYKLENSINAINIELENNNGGGDTIVEVYKEKDKLKEISLLIVDSDQKYYEAPLGNTLKRLLKVEKSQVVEIYSLHVHEIENLIPIQMIENYYRQSNNEENREDVINFLKLFKISNFDNSPLAFFDMKKGIQVKKWQENENYREYWKLNLESVKYVYDENQYIINGFGDNLLRKINSFLDKKIYEEDFMEKNMNSYIINVWKEIGKLVYSYGCSRPKKYCF